MRHYWGTSPIGSRRTKPPINTPDAGVTCAEGSGGHGQASRSTTPSLQPRVWRSRGRPGPTVPRKPAAPQAPPRRSDGGPSDGRNNSARTATPVTGHCTRYGALHPLWAAAPVMSRCTRSEGVHCLQIGCSAPNHKNKRGIRETTANTTARGRTPYGPLHPLRGATPVMGRCTRSEGVHCLRIGCSAPNHKNKRGICETTTDDLTGFVDDRTKGHNCHKAHNVWTRADTTQPREHASSRGHPGASTDNGRLGR